MVDYDALIDAYDNLGQSKLAPPNESHYVDEDGTQWKFYNGWCYIYRNGRYVSPTNDELNRLKELIRT